MSQLPHLTLETLKLEIRFFANQLNQTPISSLYGVNDGKTVGTYVEQQFRNYLLTRYTFVIGSSALGIDFPDLNLDLKVTSIKQPQSSSPFRSARQKVYGLGYALLVIGYDKKDDGQIQATVLTPQHLVYVAAERTADYQTTYGLLEILRRNGNLDDIIAFLDERRLPLDDIERESLANEIMNNPPALGYLTISNALQWRLQYGRAITTAETGNIDGLENLLA